MPPCFRCIRACLFLGAALAGGCAAAPTATVPAAAHGHPGGAAPLVSLSLPAATAADAVDAEEQWELARNDDRMGRLHVPEVAPLRILEVRHREHLRTTNARPREFTTTTRRTYERRIVE